MKKPIKTCCSIFLFLALTFFVIVGVIIVIQLHQTAMLNSKCDLPCWHGITVGETQEDEAIKVISSFSKVYYKISNNYTDLYFGKVDAIYFQRFPITSYLPTMGGDVFFKENETIYLSVGGNVGLQLHEVIEKFGEPEYVYIKPIKEFVVRAHLFYPQDGLIFVVGKIINFHSIESHSSIMGVTVLKPEEFQAYIIESPTYPVNEPFGSLFVPWSGYGELEGKYWYPKGLEE